MCSFHKVVYIFFRRVLPSVRYFLEASSKIKQYWLYISGSISHDSQALAINSSTDSDPGTVRNWVFEFLLASRAIRSGDSITTNLNVSPILIWNFFLCLKSYSFVIWNSWVHTLMDGSVKFTNFVTNLKLSCIVHITGRFNGYFLSLSLIKYNHNTYTMMIISRRAV